MGFAWALAAPMNCPWPIPVLWRLFAPALVYAAAIAFSRIYLFVHFPGAVLGGALLGAAIGVAADAWLRREEIGGKLLN